jgi:hypothetical protein
MERNLTTIEDLGALIKRPMASKEDMKGPRTEMKAEFSGRLERLVGRLM